MQRTLDFLGPRGSINDSQTYQVLAGCSGALPFGVARFGDGLRDLNLALCNVDPVRRKLGRGVELLGQLHCGFGIGQRFRCQWRELRVRLQPREVGPRLDRALRHDRRGCARGK